MNHHTQLSGPVAIGGLGGSGTRVIAEIFIQLGYYMGNDLNTASDNLWFSLLFKKPEWFIKNSTGNKSEIFRVFRIFTSKMINPDASSSGDSLFILKSAIMCSILGNHFGGIGTTGRGLWPFKRALTMLSAKFPDPSRYIAWGWKEPNTHIYLKLLEEYYDDLKYIHVVRHGLDMAYSRNQAQLYNWGEIFGIKLNGVLPLPRSALKFWIMANEHARTIGQELLGPRFLLVNYDALCVNPKSEIKNIISFIGMDVNKVNLEKLSSLARIPKSAGRYKKEDLSIYTAEEIDAVRKFGFAVEV